MNTNPGVEHQFENAAQQRHAATLGMWTFLATEVLFFGGMFLGYAAYYYQHPAGFRAASSHTLVWIGSINTGVLLLSSLLIALAVHAAEAGDRKPVARLLAGTALLGVMFLVLKGFEYRHEIQEGLLPGAGFRWEGPHPQVAEMFFYLYFLMTGVHALHVLIGIGVIGTVAFRTRRGSMNATTIDLAGLYWHFVDIVWVFLFPLIYLMGRHQ